MSSNVSWLELKLPGGEITWSRGAHQPDPYSEAGTGRAVPNKELFPARSSREASCPSASGEPGLFPPALPG